MRPLPEGVTEAQWAAAMKSHTMDVRVEVLFGGEYVTEVEVESGQVTFDATQARFGKLDCRIVTPDRLPATPGDHLAPIGYELRVARGVVLEPSMPDLVTDLGEPVVHDGIPVTHGRTQERVVWVPLGVFPIATAAIDVPGQVTSVSAWDRSWKIARAKFDAYYHVQPGTNYATAIRDLLQDRWPGIVTNFPSITFTTPHLVFDGWADPWASAQRMARSCGYGLRFDGLGVVEMVPDAQFTDTPEATLSTETNFVAASHSLDAEGSFNAQTVVSSNPSNDDVYSATVVDDDPDSITFWDGPFGHVPADPRQSEFATSDAHCAAEARSVLATTRGIPSSLSGTASPDPRWIPPSVVLGDVAEIGISQPHILDAVTLGLTPADPMSVRTRTRQVITVG